MFPDNLKYEEILFDKGVELIAGVDEVGRGALAGPFVAAAVVLNLKSIFAGIENQDNTGDYETYINNDVAKVKKDEKIKSDKISAIEYKMYHGIRDSKLMTHKKRVESSEFIKIHALSYAIIEIGNDELDKLGVSQATEKAFSHAVDNLNIKPQHIFTDRFAIKSLERDYQSNITQGDKASITISAASIIAKVYRDAIMTDLHDKYPHYDFDKNKGYGTKTHMDSLNIHGYCPIHRLSYEPIKSMVTRS